MCVVFINRGVERQSFLGSSGLHHHVDKVICHHMHPLIFQKQRQIKRLFIIDVGVFIVVDQVVGLRHLKGKVGLVGVAFHFFEEESVVAIYFDAFLVVGAHIAHMIHFYGYVVALVIGTTGLDVCHLLVNQIDIVEIAFVEKTIHPFQRIVFSIVGVGEALSQNHAYASAGMCFNRFTQPVQIQIGQVFVAVYDQHIVMACLAQREVSGCGKIADPLKIINFVGVLCRQFFGAVRGTRIHVDDFKGIVGERLQTFLDILFLVFSYDTY